MDRMDGLSRTDSSNFQNPIDSSRVSSSKKGLGGRRSSASSKGDVKGASRESENILGKSQGNIAGKPAPKPQKNLKDRKISFLKKAEVKVGRFKNITIPRLDLSKIIRGSSEAEELTPRDDEERGDYSPGKLQEGQHLPQGDDIHKAFLKPMHPRNIDVSKAPLPPPLPQAAEQLAAKQGKGSIEDNLNILPNQVQIDENTDLEIEGQKPLEAKTEITNTQQFSDAAGELSHTEKAFTQDLGKLNQLLNSEEFTNFQSTLPPDQKAILDRFKEASANLTSSQEKIQAFMDENMPVAYQIKADGSTSPTVPANESLPGKISDLVQSNDMETHLNNTGAVQRAYYEIANTPGLLRSLNTAFPSKVIPGSNQREPDIGSQLIKTVQRQGKYDALLKEVNRNVTGKGSEQLNAARTQITNLVTLNNDREALVGAKFTSFGNSDMNQALSAVKSLKSLSEQSKSQQAGLAPVREELMDKALSKLEGAQKSLAATNQAIKEVLDELKAQPGAEKFSKRITDLNKKIHEVDGVTLRQNERLREYGGVQIAYGNRNLADQLGMDLKELAPSLQRQIRALAGIGTEDAAKGMQNILEYIADAGAKSNWNMPSDQLSGIVQTAREAGVEHPTLTLKATLEAGTEGNPAENSTAKLLHSVITGPGKNAFIWGAGSISWGKEGLQGVRPFDLMAKKYSELSTEHRQAVLKVAQEFMRTGASVPVKPSDRARFEDDMRQLIASAKGDSVPANVQLANNLELQLDALPKPTKSETLPPLDPSELKTSYNFSKASADQIYGDIATFLQLNTAQLNINDPESINQLGASSSAVSHYVTHMVLSGKNPAEVLQNYKKAIDVAIIAMKKNDLGTGMAILMALGHNSMPRLGLADKIDRSRSNFLTDLSKTLAPDGSFTNLRAKISELEKNNTPYIAFTGLYTQDIFFGGEGNPDILQSGEVNTDKIEMLGKFKQKFNQVRNLAKAVKTVPSAQHGQFLSDINQFQRLTGTDDLLYNRSLELKPRGGR